MNECVIKLSKTDKGFCVEIFRSKLEQTDNHKMTETSDLKCYFKTLENAQNFMTDVSNEEWEKNE